VEYLTVSEVVEEFAISLIPREAIAASCASIKDGGSASLMTID
jgi:hypothetical protein